MNPKIIESKDFDEIVKCLPLYQELYPHFDEDYIKSTIKKLLNDRVVFVIATYRRKIVGVACYWIKHRLHCGKYIQIESMVVDKKYRGQHIATHILDYVAEVGEKANCCFQVLDVYVENHKAQKLYQAEGFVHRGYHVMKNLNGS